MASFFSKAVHGDGRTRLQFKSHILAHAGCFLDYGGSAFHSDFRHSAGTVLIDVAEGQVTATMVRCFLILTTISMYQRWRQQSQPQQRAEDCVGLKCRVRMVMGRNGYAPVP